MVIESNDTVVTDMTVRCLWLPHNLTSLTVAILIEITFVKDLSLVRKSRAFFKDFYLEVIEFKFGHSEL